MKTLPSLDAHAHLDPTRPASELAHSGAVLAMTFSLQGAALAVGRRDRNIAWGVGCHPGDLRAQQEFDIGLFRELVEQTAVVGEIGLDGGARVALRVQVQTFRQALRVITDLPRVVSIHSAGAAGLVLQELQRTPVAVPVLHGWRGTVAETRQAVALGCYFSVQAVMARHSKFRTAVPPERLLFETDHGTGDPPAAIPCRIEWTEHLIAQQLRLGVKEVRRLGWRNLRTIVRQADVHKLLPTTLAAWLGAF